MVQGSDSAPTEVRPGSSPETKTRDSAPGSGITAAQVYGEDFVQARESLKRAISSSAEPREVDGNLNDAYVHYKKAIDSNFNNHPVDPKDPVLKEFEIRFEDLAMSKGNEAVKTARIFDQAGDSKEATASLEEAGRPAKDGQTPGWYGQAIDVADKAYALHHEQVDTVIKLASKEVQTSNPDSECINIGFAAVGIDNAEVAAMPVRLRLNAAKALLPLTPSPDPDHPYSIPESSKPLLPVVDDLLKKGEQLSEQFNYPALQSINRYLDSLWPKKLGNDTCMTDLRETLGSEPEKWFSAIRQSGLEQGLDSVTMSILDKRRDLAGEDPIKGGLLLQQDELTGEAPFYYAKTGIGKLRGELGIARAALYMSSNHFQEASKVIADTQLFAGSHELESEAPPSSFSQKLSLELMALLASWNQK